MGFYLNKKVLVLDLSSGQILKMDLCKVILFLALLGISCGAESKSPCQGCKDLVDGILKGLDKTKNKNFGGGDTAWEEKKNLKTISRLGINHCKTASHFRTTSVLKRQKFAVK